MSRSTPTQPPRRHDRLLGEHQHDTYKQRGQIKGPAYCRQCGAVYGKGRWAWRDKDRDNTHAVLCSACSRIADNYPAGELMLSGKFVDHHEQEILNLVRNVESAENSEHPLNRIMKIGPSKEGILITTTDIHLPRRIGTALKGAWEGELDIHFDDGAHFTRVRWQRD